MADTNNLTNFLGDIADAIRNKTGEVNTIPAANFDNMINSIETGINTADANALNTDILLNQTAYVNGEKITGTIPTQNSNVDFNVSNIAVELVPAVGNVEGLVINDFTNIYNWYSSDYDRIQNIKLIAKSLIEAYGYKQYWYAYVYNDGSTGSSGNVLFCTVIMSDTPMTGYNLSSYARGVQSTSPLYRRTIIWYQNNITEDTMEVINVDPNTNTAHIGNPGSYTIAPYANNCTVDTNCPDITSTTFSGYSYKYNGDLSIVWLESAPSTGIITKFTSNSPVFVNTNTIIQETINNPLIANTVGLTPNILANGVTILGVTGTLSGGGEDLDNVLNNQEALIANLQNQVNVLNAALDNAGGVGSANYNSRYSDEMNTLNVFSSYIANDTFDYMYHNFDQEYGAATYPENIIPWHAFRYYNNVPLNNIFDASVANGVHLIINYDVVGYNIDGFWVEINTANGYSDVYLSASEAEISRNIANGTIFANLDFENQYSLEFQYIPIPNTNNIGWCLKGYDSNIGEDTYQELNYEGFCDMCKVINRYEDAIIADDAWSSTSVSLTYNVQSSDSGNWIEIFNNPNLDVNMIPIVSNEISKMLTIGLVNIS